MSRRNWLFAAMAALWLLLIVLFWQQQALTDWWRLRGYEPPAEITRLADSSGMNDVGSKLFYLYEPRVEPAEDFNKHCQATEYTIVLGCYVSKTGIYLFSVSDDRLSGVKEVTAAHEMLHVAYERLSSKERARIDALTKQAYASLRNERVRRNVEQYRSHDASIVPNELHSILGTEIADLPDELEAYYARYFNDRQKVVRHAEAYEAEFTRREEQAATYSTTLSQLKTQIDKNNNDLRVEQVRLTREYNDIEAQRGSLPTAAFNRRVGAYNEAVESYNQLVAETRETITEYNKVVAQYNAVVLEQRELYRAISSSPELIET